MPDAVLEQKNLADSLEQCEKQHQHYIKESLSLDITRGKPAAEQLDLADELLTAPEADEVNQNSSLRTDLRNYGVVDGLPVAKQLFGSLLDIPEADCSDCVFVGGNSSLSLMHYTLMWANFLGLQAGSESWQAESQRTNTVTKILCPCPGYDRHFALCEEFGIEMVIVPLTGNGPDMDVVEKLVADDPAIKGIWCVPRFSNPTGEVYSDETVKRLAALPKIAGANFYVLWDNAYAVHALHDNAADVACIHSLAKEASTEDSVIQFGSTSKITYAGAGIGYMASGPSNIKAFTQRFGKASIGSDKINQYRHIKFLKNRDNVLAHMRKHAALIAPKFAVVEKILSENFSANDMGEWNSVEGGYFISFNTRKGLAKKIVSLAAEAGVKLTPAGATFPLGKDPEDRNIRIAPTYPSLDELEKAMEVFVNCVKLASFRQEAGA